MKDYEAIALVVVLIMLTLGMIIPSVKFISKNLDIQPARATVRVCCR